MSPTVANFSPSTTPAQFLHSPPITVALTVLLLLFFLLGFFSIYFCRCIMDGVLHTWHLHRSPSGQFVGVSSGVTPVHPGLDPVLVKSFPTFIYSSVKDVRKEKYGLECAICLAEFHENSLLRLLTVCYHVFHQECVDLWLEAHKTCPVCRRDLDSPNANSLPPMSPENIPAAGNEYPTDEDVRVEVKDDNDEEEGDEDDITQCHFHEFRRKYNEKKNNARVRVCNTDERAAMRKGDCGGSGDGERFTRSHSTGHSIAKVRLDDEHDHDEDRYTLRLPDHVRLRIIRARHWTASCETYGDFDRLRFGATTTTCDNCGSVLGESSGSIPSKK